MKRATPMHDGPLRKHVEASRSEFPRAIAQVASEEANEIDGTSRNGECRRRLDKLDPLPSEGKGSQARILSGAPLSCYGTMACASFVVRSPANCELRLALPVTHCRDSPSRQER